MFHNFSEEARKIIALAKAEMDELKHPYVGSEHLLLAILKKKSDISNRLKEHHLFYDRLKREIIDTIGYGSKESEWHLYTPALKRILETAISIGKELGMDVTSDILFMGLLEEGEGIAFRLLINMGIDIDKLYHEFVVKPPKKSKKKKLLIEEIGVEFTDVNKNSEFDPVIGREKELKRIMEILTRRTKNNPLLIGEAGVGKTALIEELSRVIIKGEVPSRLLGKRIISVDMSTLVAGTKYRGEFEEKINRMIKEIEENDDIILFIDEIHTLIGAGGAEGAIDAANIFKPALARNKMHCIGATTMHEYKKYMENDKALERRFQTVLIEEPKSEIVKKIIYQLKPIYEKYHRVYIADDIVELLLGITKKYIHNRQDPDKTIDVLDEVCSHANLKENKKIKTYRGFTNELSVVMKLKKNAIINNEFDDAIQYKQRENELMNEINSLEIELANNERSKVTKKDLYEVLKTKIEAPIYELSFTKLKKENIINRLKKEIIGQDRAIEELVNTHINNLGENRCYAVMLAGPSGVGKTALAQLFAKAISSHLLRLDMSEYSESHSISKLIGSPAGYMGYNDNTNLFEEIRTYPFTILLLDEIEKAHSKVISLFLQILDNSSIKDAKGTTISFNNVIVLITTNIYEKKELGFQNTSVANKELNDFFGVPFINRIDKIILFNTLIKENIIEILNSILKREKRYKNWKIPLKTKEKIVNKTNFSEYGARQIKPVLKEFYLESNTQNIN